MADSLDPLVKLLQAPECRPLLDRLCKKLVGGELLAGRIRLTRLSDQQQRAISALTGRNARSPAAGGSVTVDLDAFSQVVCNTGRFTSLRQLVELAHGQAIQNRRIERDVRNSAWDEVWRYAEEMSQLSESPLSLREKSVSLTDLFRELRRTGWLKRVSHSDPQAARDLLEQAFHILRFLPTSPIPLAIFAATQTGNAHSLDSNQVLGRLLLKMIESLQAVDKGPNAKKANRSRRIWESVGLVPDELSSSALVLNLPATGASFTDAMLLDHQQAGMPCRLTFRHLRLAEPKFSSVHSDNGRHSALYVCENPSVMAAAAELLGPRCPSMVCVEGHPTLACWTVLKRLTESGRKILYHGDFDWGGIRIANAIYESFGFRPWRFTADDHRVTANDHRRLKPPPAKAIWDPQLSKNIQASGVAVEEESVIDDLLSDLQRAANFASGD